MSLVAERISPADLAAAADRRSHPREPVSRTARLFQGRFAWDCRIVDASAGGARLTGVGAVPSSAPVLLVDLASGVAYEAAVIWTKAGDLGVQFRATWDLRAPVPMWLRGAKGCWEMAARG